jgi:hypothetical protein
MSVADGRTLPGVGVGNRKALLRVEVITATLDKGALATVAVGSVVAVAVAVDVAVVVAVSVAVGGSRVGDSVGVGDGKGVGVARGGAVGKAVAVSLGVGKTMVPSRTTCVVLIITPVGLCGSPAVPATPSVFA